MYRTKRRFVLGNLAAALSEEPRPGAKRKLSSKEQALLVATACSKPRRRARRPVVCFDESPIQFIGEVRALILPKPGQLERYDCE